MNKNACPCSIHTTYTKYVIAHSFYPHSLWSTVNYINSVLHLNFAHIVMWELKTTKSIILIGNIGKFAFTFSICTYVTHSNHFLMHLWTNLLFYLTEPNCVFLSFFFSLVWYNNRFAVVPEKYKGYHPPIDEIVKGKQWYQPMFSVDMSNSIIHVQYFFFWMFIVSSFECSILFMVYRRVGRWKMVHSETVMWGMCRTRFLSTKFAKVCENKTTALKAFFISLNKNICFGPPCSTFDLKKKELTKHLLNFRDNS